MLSIILSLIDCVVSVSKTVKTKSGSEKVLPASIAPSTDNPDVTLTVGPVSIPVKVGFATGK